MNRKEVYKEIEGMFGLVPSMFKAVPDSALELEWKLFQRVQMDAGPIPNKYRELIGVAISALWRAASGGTQAVADFIFPALPRAAYGRM